MAFNIISVLRFLNWSPLLHVSNDDNFDSIENLSTTRTFITSCSIMPFKDKDRISLLAIELGERKFYICSFLRNDSSNSFCFKLFECLSFYGICKKFNKNEIDLKAKKYRNLISRTGYDDKKISIQVEFLKEKFNQNKDIRSFIYNKINNYLSINLAHIAFMGYLFTEILSIKDQNSFYYFFLVIFGMTCLYVVNNSFFIWSGLSVKSFTRSTLKELKADSTNIQLATNYYTDWIASKNETEILASILRNIEKYFIRGIVFAILSWLILITGLKKNETPLSTNGYVNESFIESKKFYFFDNIFQSNLVDIGNARNGMHNHKEYKPEVIKPIETKKSYKKARNKKTKNKNIKVKIINNNTVIIKYKD